MLIRFIAHAGIAIEEGGYFLLIDPWFYDSTPEYPVFESIGGGFKTIDFQLPKTTEHIESYAPHAILISHFHPHHSPSRDIQQLCRQGTEKNGGVVLAYPRSLESMEEKLRENVPLGVDRKGVVPGDSFVVGPFTIVATEHTSPLHAGWLVRSQTGSVLHLADARFNRINAKRELDPVWDALAHHKPSLFLTSTGGHSVRRVESDGTRTIRESETLSPIEAAQLTAHLSPQAVGLIGMYNHSVWKKNTEYILDTPIAEEQFGWALSWLAPTIKYVRLAPSYRIGIGDETVRSACDVFLQAS